MDQEESLIQAYCKKRDEQAKADWEHYSTPLNTAGVRCRPEWCGNPTYDENAYKLGGRLHSHTRGPDPDE